MGALTVEVGANIPVVVHIKFKGRFSWGDWVFHSSEVQVGAGARARAAINGRESYSERPNYEQILKKIIPDYKIKPEDVFVVGDIFTLDLSLPHRLGMNCILIENDLKDGFKTPIVFIEHARRSNIPVISGLEDLIV